MASIVICGGSVIGLSAAMMLARNGHRVTVLERDPAPPPAATADAFDQWPRKGVAQFHQPHTLLPPFRAILDSELPGTVDRLVDAGCVWLDWLAVMPPLVRGSRSLATVVRGPSPCGRRRRTPRSVDCANPTVSTR